MSYRYIYSNRQETDLFVITIRFPNQPIIIQPGNPFRQTEAIKLLEPTNIYKIGIWNGVDAGNEVEMDTWIFDERNMLLAGRSKHKETRSDYDGMEPLYWIEPAITTKKIRIGMTCWSTNHFSVRAHWSVYLWCIVSERAPHFSDRGQKKA